ncbi:MAG TPA: ABC transporter substrate-binding protein [Gammaproteobacteria bacterium]|nr:ABC transporter substrate-binding protein [Gammaproteobacteria bacterium]
MKRGQWWAALLGGLVAVAVGASVGPEEVVKGTTDQVFSRIKADEPSLKQDVTRLYNLVNELIIPHFDFQRASQLVLGKNWRGASDDQRLRFAEAFKELMVRTYANALFQYVDQQITYKSVEPEQDGKIMTVRTQIEQPGAEPVAVNYRMHEVNGEWKVYDVIVGGISLLVTYRDSFSSEISQSGIDALIAHLQSHNQELAAKNTPHPAAAQ